MKHHTLLPATKKCPRCGTLKPQLKPVDDGSEWVRCSAVVSWWPYEECDFYAPGSVLHLPFVRIGASGLPAFGQSTWNFVSHARIWNSGSLLGNSFSRLDWWKGNDAADLQYESQLIGHGSMATGPTRRDAYWTLTSSPAFFGRRRNFILSVEDWAGEWISHGISSEECNRLVDCDAFMLFLTPTRPYEELQDHAMPKFEAFFSQLKAHRKAIKQPVDVPVAIAMPMLDVVPASVPPEIVSRAEQLICEIRSSGPMNEATTLAAMQRRHQLAMELSRGVTPLPRLVSICESVASPIRVRVFPMATLGWSAATHETLGTLGPWKAHQHLLKTSFGILDPILWVLHQLGLRRLPAA